MHAARARVRPTALVVVAALAFAVAGCSDDDPAAVPTSEVARTPATTMAPLSTEPPETTADAATTAAPTTEAPPTTAAPETTPAPPTTVDVDAVKAQIAAGLLESDALLVEIVANPSLEDLERRALEAAAPPFSDVIISRVRDLVAKGDRVVAGDPPIHIIDVEQVTWDPANPVEATLLACQVDNSVQLTPGAGPNGEDVLVAGTGQLIARRYNQHVVRTEFGWRPDAFQPDALGVWFGAETCPPA